jgi:hypothetical protein
LKQTISLAQPEQWNQTLKQVPGADIFYYAGYCKLFEEKEKSRGGCLLPPAGGDLIYPLFFRSINSRRAFTANFPNI